MISLHDLQKASNGQLFGEPMAQLFTDFCFQVGQAKEGMLFVAQRNAHGDTHPDIEEAIHRGVAGVLCHEPPTCDTSQVTVLMVRESVDALLAWAHFVIGKLGIKVIAVAGTSGKSVAVRAIGAVLSLKHPTFAGDVDHDGRLSLPVSVAKMPLDTRYLVVKLSPTNPSDMVELVQACQPQVGIINHLDCIQPASFTDCNQLVEEHAKLIDYLSPSDLAILNFDEDITRELATRTRAIVRTVGIGTFGADLVAVNVLNGLDRTGFDLRYENDARFVGRWSPILGKHQLYGLLVALLVGVHCGVPLADSLKRLTELESLGGRMKPLFGKNGSILIDDTFRANTSSTLAALDWLEAVRVEGQRVIFVMGDMDNLGSASQYGHRMVGARVAQVADYLITVGSEASIVGRSAIDQQMPTRQISITYGVQEAISAILSLNLTADDVVLVKGGGQMVMEQVVRGLLADPADVALLVRQDERLYTSTRAQYTLNPHWLEIDTDRLAQNVRAIRARLAEDVTLMAVVKANAYGHGALMTARTALANGAGYLGVANMAEAIQLRDSGITAPILVLTHLPIVAVRQAIRENITATVYDLSMAQQYDRMARSANGRLKVHVKLDTGMGRLGILARDAIGVFRHLSTLHHLDIEGIYTHFASADDNEPFTQQQLEVFRSAVRPLRAGGFQFKYVHASNSPATLLSSELHFNMVRTGLMMYGLQPSELVPLPEEISPIMTWKTTVLQVKTLPPNHSVGYGRTYFTQGKETIAILPVGYADGLRRSPAWREVLIQGQRAPLVGRISMEKCAVNVTHLPPVNVGDEVVLLGIQGESQISAEEVAQWLGTINYEVVTNIRSQA